MAMTTTTTMKKTTTKTTRTATTATSAMTSTSIKTRTTTTITTATMAMTKQTPTHYAGEEGSRRREARKRGTLGSDKVWFLKKCGSQNKMNIILLCNDSNSIK